MYYISIYLIYPIKSVTRSLGIEYHVIRSD